MRATTPRSISTSSTRWTGHDALFGLVAARAEVTSLALLARTALAEPGASDEAVLESMRRWLVDAERDLLREAVCD